MKRIVALGFFAVVAAWFAYGRLTAHDVGSRIGSEDCQETRLDASDALSIAWYDYNWGRDTNPSQPGDQHDDGYDARLEAALREGQETWASIVLESPECFTEREVEEAKPAD